MEPKYTILAIDDDKFFHKILARALSGRFRIESVYSGEQGLQRVHALHPDIVLLDVEMPGMNGYEVCDVLKRAPETREIPIVFVSGRNSVREMMQGYEMGGTDYLVKPFENKVLLAKLMVLLHYREEQLKLKQSIDEAKKTAYTVMSGNSELGLAVRFIERSYDACDYKTLAENLFLTTGQLGLKCVVYMETREEGGEWFSSSGAISPLEMELMSHLRDGQRLHHFGCRTQVNFSNISLLVKNMPLDDMDRYGRTKDLLPALLGASDSKVRTLNTEIALLEQTKALNAAFDSVQDTLNGLAKNLQANQAESTVVMREMLDELSGRLPYMGLEEDQEEYILSRIEQATEEAMRLIGAGKDIKSTFDMVMCDLQQIALKQRELLEKILRKGEQFPESVHDSDQQDDEAVMAIELF